jgi:hypothetical protein
MMKLIIRDPSNLITLFDQSPEVIAPVKNEFLHPTYACEERKNLRNFIVR